MYQSFTFLPAGRQIPFFSFLEKNVIVALQNLAEIGGALKGSLGRAVPPWPSNPRGNPHRKGVGMLVVSLRGVNFGMVSFRGQKNLGWLGYTQIGLLKGFNSKFPTSIPTPFICGVPPGFKPCLRQKSLISLLCLRQETLLSDPDLFCFAYRFK